MLLDGIEVYLAPICDNGERLRCPELAIFEDKSNKVLDSNNGIDSNKVNDSDEVDNSNVDNASSPKYKRQACNLLANGEKFAVVIKFHAEFELYTLSAVHVAVAFGLGHPLYPGRRIYTIQKSHVERQYDECVECDKSGRITDFELHATDDASQADLCERDTKPIRYVTNPETLTVTITRGHNTWHDGSTTSYGENGPLERRISKPKSFKPLTTPAYKKPFIFEFFGRSPDWFIRNESIDPAIGQANARSRILSQYQPVEDEGFRAFAEQAKKFLQRKQKSWLGGQKALLTRCRNSIVDQAEEQADGTAEDDKNDEADERMVRSASSTPSATALPETPKESEGSSRTVKYAPVKFCACSKKHTRPPQTGRAQSVQETHGGHPGRDTPTPSQPSSAFGMGGYDVWNAEADRCSSCDGFKVPRMRQLGFIKAWEEKHRRDEAINGNKKRSAADDKDDDEVLPSTKKLRTSSRDESSDDEIIVSRARRSLKSLDRRDSRASSTTSTSLSLTGFAAIQNAHSSTAGAALEASKTATENDGSQWRNSADTEATLGNERGHRVIPPVQGSTPLPPADEREHPEGIPKTQEAERAKVEITAKQTPASPPKTSSESQQMPQRDGPEVIDLSSDEESTGAVIKTECSQTAFTTPGCEHMPAGRLASACKVETRPSLAPLIRASVHPGTAAEPLNVQDADEVELEERLEEIRINRELRARKKRRMAVLKD